MTKDEEKRDADIARLISSEATIRRGRGLKDREEREKERRLAADIIKAMQYGDERSFSALLRTYGVKDGDSRWINAWKAYRAFRGQS